VARSAAWSIDAAEAAEAAEAAASGGGRGGGGEEGEGDEGEIHRYDDVANHWYDDVAQAEARAHDGANDYEAERLCETS